MRSPEMSKLLADMRQLGTQAGSGVVPQSELLELAKRLEDVSTETDDDWEAQNKRAFIELVKVYAGPWQTSAFKRGSALYGMLKLKKGCIPINVNEAAREYAAWLSFQSENTEAIAQRPKWCVFMAGDGIPGY